MSPRIKPYYRLEEFIRACRRKKDVALWECVRKDAREWFGIYSEDDILEFIFQLSQGEELQYRNTEELRSSALHGVMVDAYTFRSLCRPGYVAFFKIPGRNNWVVKSLHQDDEAVPSFALALKKAGIGKGDFKK